MSDFGDNTECCLNDIDCCACLWLDNNPNTNNAASTSNDWLLWYLIFSPTNRRDSVHSGAPHSANIIHEQPSARNTRYRVTPQYVLRRECKIVFYFLILILTIIGILLLARVI